MVGSAFSGLNQRMIECGSGRLDLDAMFRNRHIPAVKRLVVLWVNGTASKVQIRKLRREDELTSKQRFRELAKTINPLVRLHRASRFSQ